MQHFNYRTHDVKVIFGRPILEALKEELPKKKITLGLLASERNEGLAEQIRKLESVDRVYHFSKITQHVPLQLVDEAFGFFSGKEVDIILCLGGGSAIGLGKALALRMSADLWAVPTTYSGSEMTNIFGISQDGKKTVKRDDRVHPKKVFYDPKLSLGMPLSLATPSAFNAMAHLVEALYSPESNPITHQLTILGLTALFEGLKELSQRRKLTTEINEKMFFGAYLGGKVLCEVSMGLHHKSAHVLGGNFALDHAQVHTLLLPYVLEYQWEYLDKGIKEDYINVFGNESPYKTIRTLQEKLEVGFSLSQLGFRKEDISKAVDFLMMMNYPNPAPLQQEKLESMLKKAF